MIYLYSKNKKRYKRNIKKNKGQTNFLKMRKYKQKFEFAIYSNLIY